MSGEEFYVDHNKKINNIQAEIDRLAKEINHHDQLYFSENKPEIPDADYDALRQRYAKLAASLDDDYRPDPDPGSSIGAAPKSGFRKRKHITPILSLNNAHNAEELKSFIESTCCFLQLTSEDSLALIAEPKIDGLSVSLIYENGTFSYGATRGNGYEGEDVTRNLLTIPSLPKQLASEAPAWLDVRGEVYMTKANFLALNQHQEKHGKPAFANPRNAAAGSLRQLDPSITQSRSLHIFIYEIGSYEGEKCDVPSHHQAKLAWLSKLNFPVNPEVRLCNHLEEAEAYHDDLLARRDDLDYEIDGIVYKVAHGPMRKRLGDHARAPRWAISRKFPPSETITRLNHIRIQVGRHGKLTPVAILEPVIVGGVTIRRASLHNEDEIARKDIREGDFVRIYRAGDVIPQITAAEGIQRPPTSVPFRFPHHCPECGAQACRIDGEANRRCIAGWTCPAQRVERLRHFVSRDAFDIEGLGQQHIEAFFKEGRIGSPADLFTLATRDGHNLSPLAQCKGWGEISASNLFAAIEERRHTTLDRFIFALGIPHIGQEMSRLLARHYGSITNLMMATTTIDPIESDHAANHDTKLGDLRDLDQIGPKLAQEWFTFFAEERNQKLVRDLLAEVNVESVHIDQVRSQLSGKVIVFTGALSMSRREAKTRAEAAGARVANAVSANVDTVVIGKDPGKKMYLARELKLEILDEASFQQLLS